MRRSRMIVFDGRPYVVFSNPYQGAEVWRSADGLAWQQQAAGGWGNAALHYSGYHNKGAIVLNNRLYMATTYSPGAARYGREL